MCISEKRIRLLQSVDKAEPGSCRDFVVLRRGCFVVLAIKSFLKFALAVKRTGISLIRHLKMLQLNLLILKMQAEVNFSSGNRRFPGDVQMKTQK